MSDDVNEFVRSTFFFGMEAYVVAMHYSTLFFVIKVVLFVGFFITIINFFENGYYKKLRCKESIRCIFATISFIILFFSIFSSTTEPVNSSTEGTAIYGLNINHGITGTFVLGSGAIKNESVYYFYQKNDNGNFIIKHEPSDIVEIKLDDSIPPQISSLTSVQERTYYFLGVPVYTYSYSLKDSKILTVPSNCIKQDFQI